MSILISTISLGSQLVKKYNLEEINSIKAKIMIGLVSGALGIVLMMFSVKVYDGAILDFRNIAIIMSAIFGGGIPVLISGFMIAMYRVLNFGINLASILGVLSAIINTIGCWIISKYKIASWKKWTYATINVLVVTSIALFILLRSREDFYIIMLIYSISYCFVSIITYWYIKYSLTANKVYRRLQKEATKDFLTNLNNVRQFDTILNNALINAHDNDESLSLLMIDIDFFKRVNDIYGHKEGDIVLKGVGNIIEDSCRAFDEVSRNGGEEFSVILKDCPNSQAILIAERIRSNVEKHPFVLSTGKQMQITVSIGVASYPETVGDLDKIVEKVDTELYMAKRTGRNKVCSD
jgi:diguanylate cyclase